MHAHWVYEDQINGRRNGLTVIMMINVVISLQYFNFAFIASYVMRPHKTEMLCYSTLNS
jgi:hypothetical protein